MEGEMIAWQDLLVYNSAGKYGTLGDVLIEHPASCLSIRIDRYGAIWYWPGYMVFAPASGPVDWGSFRDSLFSL